MPQRFEKCVHVVTDGIRAKKWAGWHSKRTWRVNCPRFHSIIHKQPLCAKLLQAYKFTISASTNLTSSKGEKGSRDRKFIQFFKAVDAEYADVPLLPEIRWLSAGKAWKHFALRKEIVNFIQNKLYNS